MVAVLTAGALALKAHLQPSHSSNAQPLHLIHYQHQPRWWLRRTPRLKSKRIVNEQRKTRSLEVSTPSLPTSIIAQSGPSVGVCTNVSRDTLLSTCTGVVGQTTRSLITPVTQGQMPNARRRECCNCMTRCARVRVRNCRVAIDTHPCGIAPAMWTGNAIALTSPLLPTAV